jgi:hypothetical protein
VILGLLAGVAFALDPACAPGSYDEGKLQGALERAEAALLSGNVEPARVELIDAHRQVLCLPAVAKPSQVSRLSRDLALAFFYDQDDDAARRWGLSSRYAAPLPWDDATFPEGHPFRDGVDGAEEPPLGGPDGKGLAYPKKGAVFANGKLLAAPKAPAEVPLLVQVADKDGAIVASWWQDGAAFPESVIGPPGPAPVAPKWWTPEPAPTAPVTVAVAAVAAPPEPEPIAAAEPPPVAVVEPPKPVAALPVEPPEPGAYVDPFSDARRRALAREVSTRETVDAAGNRTVVRTEVITFASDPSNGAPVSGKHYAEWLVDFPEWAPGGEMARRSADESYLKGWKDARTPPDPAAPVTWVSFAAASAYCGSWGNRVAQADQAAADALAREWRESSGKPVWKRKDGSVEAADARATAGDVGFRCAP